MIFAAVIVIGGLHITGFAPDSESRRPPKTAKGTNYPEYLERFEVPEYEGYAMTEINGNVPFFDIGSEKAGAYEYYAPLDRLGRCTYAEACLSEELMPKDERGDISSIRPTAWHSIKNDMIDGGYLYNRCHLIAYMLTGENANERNIVTGTRYMNIEGMLLAEFIVDDYIMSSGNHVHYRVTPVFERNDLMARGVLIEARSVEDEGEGLSLCIFCHNVQPGFEINYADGSARQTE